jgi:glycosyltransferase involved in cell wall biosynthesis
VLEVTKLRRFPVVTVSEYAKTRLVHYGLRSEDVGVIYNGGDHILRTAEDERVLLANGLDRAEFLLLVGSVAKHKNLPFALEALLPLCGARFRIAVVGLAQVGNYRGSDPMMTDPRVTVLPRITDGELRALYRRAKVVIAPSLCEGFGLYVAEAMFAGSGPLVLSNRTALPEVGGDAALYFDPTEAESLRKAVSLALQPGTAERLFNAAAKRKSRYQWSRAATAIIEHYLEADEPRVRV